MNSRKNGPVTDFKMEQYLIGALPENEMKELREREASDEIFAARVRELREQNAKILKENPFENLARDLDKMDAVAPDMNDVRATIARFNMLKIAAAVVIALGIFSAVFVVDKDDVFYSSETKDISANMDVAMATVDDQTRIKGMDARMEVWKKSEGGIVQLDDMSTASEGDEIQLRYSVPEKCYGMIFSMDGNGTLTVHMGNDNAAIALEPGKMISLPYAYKLDDAPHFEKFFLLTSQKEFAVYVGQLDEILKQDGIKTVTVTLRKNGGV
ncbi:MULTISPECIES: hypothetical protein [unclassified Fibrobacter]|uniref:hypothetical protein n=1 Tax=unclassified Fibrobacter TaxID=2634177 RepID=UPI000D6CF3A8|nr:MULTISPECIES: hypothetical protein [unclassified Fibrobacter]PWJ70062.1 hypothetical protein BGX12_10327 [Fibrobacter sp. UWR4]PZW73410.1 hypothetical protein C8E88_100328 [Fibrobacter sp. UWR1]